MHRQAPQFKLKPLPVAILEKPLPKNAFFTKVDLAEAYYHFTLSPPQSTSHHLPTRWRVQLLHKTTRLRALGVWAWSHLDIFLLAHTDLAFLATVTRQFTTHLTNCGININPKDTQSEPTQTIKFLGLLLKGRDQMIGHTGPRKQDLATLLQRLKQPLPLKTVKRFVGHLVFYFSRTLSHANHLVSPSAPTGVLAK